VDIKKNVLLAEYSNFHIGGVAKKLITASSADDLVSALNNLKKNNETYKIFAGGTNVVFPDEGIADTLVRMWGGDIKVDKNNLFLIADAGVKLAALVDKAIELGWIGLENLSGIPGTVGGAVYGNAGAYGTELKDVVDSVEIYDQGARKWLNNDDCQFAYRTSIFKSQEPGSRQVILRVKLKLASKGSSKEMESKSQDIIKTREEKYPKELMCPGSFFKNLLADKLTRKQLKNISSDKIKHGKVPAGYLLEDVGAKGKSVGDIKVAPYHANLICNEGHGTASQVKKLAEELRQLVLDKFGIRLEEEVRYF